MLVSTREMLQQAKENGYAIPAPNFFDFNSARSYVEVAEGLNRPLILAFAQAHTSHLSLEDATKIGRYFAKRAKVPVALHLDHGSDEAFIKKAIDLGFSSVMIDASTDKLEDNIRKTKKIVAYAKPREVTVEAEIGHVGSGENYESHEQADSIYTEPSEALQFAKETCVDSLAVSIGTAHGFYKGVPEINFDCLHEIASKIAIPLVLHGGSSSGEDNLHRCATEGIAKVNLFTDLVTAAVSELKKEQPEDFLTGMKQAEKAMKQTLEKYYHVFATKEWGDN